MLRSELPALLRLCRDFPGQVSYEFSSRVFLYLVIVDSLESPVNLIRTIRMHDHWDFPATYHLLLSLLSFPTPTTIAPFLGEV